MLWIALYLPDLPLQLAQRACATPQLHAGVAPPHAENAVTPALRSLACWASQFTPNVLLQPGAGLLLEVGSTLQMHGGLSRLLMRLGRGLQDLGYRVNPGFAPTALAAWLFAKARHDGLPVRMCRNVASLPEHLASLPLALLGWPADDLQKLHALGIRSIGACASLPRDGFIRRFGAQHRLELDRLFGREPDPHAWFAPPDTFTNRIEFGFDVNDALMLLFPLKRLLQELEGFLRGRSAGVQHWQLVLEHSGRRTTVIDMRTSTPERNAERLLALAREKLGQITLQSSVLGLAIAASELLVFEESNRSFIPDPRSRAIGWDQLVDKLIARLGGAGVFRLRAIDDHRPERAWRESGASGAGYPPATVIHSPRPLWLLRTPRTLLSEDGMPLCQGRLRLLTGPERIESGWWDGRSARRDYYVARSSKGETLWIYREHRRSKDWYLHGLFG